MATVYLALGSNMGERARHIMQAYIEINDLPGTKVKGVSQIIETPPAGGPPGQEDYLNGACVIETQFPPDELLDNLLAKPYLRLLLTSRICYTLPAQWLQLLHRLFPWRRDYYTKCFMRLLW